MSQRKKRFTEYSPAQQFGLGALIMLSLALVAAAERDIQRRSADDIRGSKSMWRLVCMNAVGAVGYLLCGRRVARR